MRSPTLPEELPCSCFDISDRTPEVMVIYQPLEAESKTKTPQELGWKPGFFENTFSAWEGEPLVREP
ncbi:hypothetical protein WA1_35655 [Scytonema hofmannii PCC 7110]|uniref:Uncharacterized protein n=1 Tax=Scytonema hofmannii PCC 7110 TaxID=128403 RepID=A0A139X1E0_9CYAN|nr:hypothetical protein [Scytonema hofmannii]KYC38527.1 hypothetical protein WA1_35655 [Scytonema hofmannii PCC 7110]